MKERRERKKKGCRYFSWQESGPEAPEWTESHALHSGQWDIAVRACLWPTDLRLQLRATCYSQRKQSRPKTCVCEAADQTLHTNSQRMSLPQLPWFEWIWKAEFQSLKLNGDAMNKGQNWYIWQQGSKNTGALTYCDATFIKKREGYMCHLDLVMIVHV